MALVILFASLAIALAGCASPAQPVSGENSSSASDSGVDDASTLAEQAAEDEAEQIATPAYTVTIPEEWRGNYSYDFETEAPPEGTSELGFAWHVKVYLGPDYAFDVAALTEDWGLQGNFRYVNLGLSQTYPGWNVFIYTPLPGSGGAQSDPNDFAGWVSISGGNPE